MIDTNPLIGVPFVFGGRDPATGLDCWGLVAHVLRDAGLPMPSGDWEPETLVEGHRMMTEQSESGAWTRADGDVGDVAAMYRGNWVIHVGVVVKPGLILHTSRATGALLQSAGAMLRQAGFSRLVYFRWGGSS